MWVNVIPLLDDVGGHTDIHAQASLFISDQEVQNAGPNNVESPWHKPF